MKVFNMFITAVCVIFLIKLRWSKTKSLYDTFILFVLFCFSVKFPIRAVPGSVGFWVVPVRFRVAPAPSDKFLVGSAFYILPLYKLACNVACNAEYNR